MLKPVYEKMFLAVIFTFIIVYNMVLSFLVVTLLQILSGEHRWPFYIVFTVGAGVISSSVILYLVMFWSRISPLLGYANMRAILDQVSDDLAKAKAGGS